MSQILDVLFLLFAWVMIFIAGHGIGLVIGHAVCLGWNWLWPTKEPEDRIHLTLVNWDEEKWNDRQ